MEILKNPKNKIAIICIVICILLLISVTSITTLYSDDFFYFSFTQNGLEHFIKSNINHYLNVNGRVIVHLVDEIILFIGKVAYIPMLIFMLLYIFYTANKIILSHIMPKEKLKDNLLYSICISFILFLGIDVFILKETAFWITRCI